MSMSSSMSNLVSASCLAWDEACRRCEALTRAMGQLGCMRSYDGDERECWKREEWTDEYRPVSPQDWCVPCLERQALYLERREAARHRGVRLRALRRFIRNPELLP